MKELELNFFNFFDGYPWSAAEEQREQGYDPKAYLRREGRILSLAKERNLRRSKKMDDLQLKLLLGKIKSEDFNSVLALSEKIVRKVISSLSFCEDGLPVDDAAYKSLMRCIPSGVTAKIAVDYNHSIWHLGCLKRSFSAGEKMLKVTLSSNGLTKTFSGLWLSSVNRESRIWKDDKTNIISIQRLFGFLLICRVVEDKIAELDGLDEPCQEPLFAAIKKGSTQCTPELALNQSLRVKTGRRRYMQCPDGGVVSSIAAGSNLLPVLRRMFDGFGDFHEETPELSEGMVVLSGTAFFNTFEKNFFLWHFTQRGKWGGVFDRTDVFAFFSQLRGDIMDHRDCPLSVGRLILAIRKEARERAAQEKILRELSGDYALSFMTKKHIPRETLRAMSESGFNAYFGYVEYDEDVDLPLVEEVLKEFSAVKDAFLGGVDSTLEVIRFRKLGHHHAAGIYFPEVHCMCVDVRYPSSLIHEYGHLIDFTYGELSMKADFERVKELYGQRLRKAADQTGNEVLKGSTKYNLDYYLTPTEIFARCFEVWMVFVNNVDNSIIPKEKVESSFAHPHDEEMLKAVRDYFDALKSMFCGEGNVKAS